MCTCNHSARSGHIHSENRKTVVINQSLATSSSFNVNLMPELQFVPKKVIVRQLLYANIAGADNGTYLISSSLTSNSYFGAVYIGIQGVSHFPETVINLPNHQQYTSISFNVVPANAAYGAATGNLTLVLEFIEN